jgi:aminoglycoside phosphotransferase (APT) family kinase protein
VDVGADPDAGSRRERALRSAAAVAQAYGLDASRAHIIQDWNDTIVHLAPSPLVARVATSSIRSEFSEKVEQTFSREIAVVRHAAARGAPVVPPSEDPPAGPHRFEGNVLTLWRLVETLPGGITANEAGAALRGLHDALADYSGPLPPLDDRLDLAESFVDNPRALPALPENDRELLARAFVRLRRRVDRTAKTDRVLHGGAHDGNLLRTRERACWIDFDTVCRGPAEWDVAHLPPMAARHFPEIDEELLEHMRGLVSAEVAVWCWHAYGRAREVDEAARFHLERVRTLSTAAI